MDRRAEFIEHIRELVTQGKSVQEIRDIVSKVNPELLAQLNSVPRDNIRQFVAASVRCLQAKSPFIDVGCGDRSSKAEVLASLGTEEELKYWAFDHWFEIKPDFLADASAISLISGCANTVICTEVLEHVKDDKAVLKEIKRILSPGGLLILTLPGGAIPKHEKLPYQIDYRRYKTDQIQQTLQDLDFFDINISQHFFEEFEINIFVRCRKFAHNSKK